MEPMEAHVTIKILVKVGSPQKKVKWFYPTYSYLSYEHHQGYILLSGMINQVSFCIFLSIQIIQQLVNGLLIRHLCGFVRHQEPESTLKVDRLKYALLSQPNAQ